MKETLKEILAELKFQTKLLENIFHNKDKDMHDSKKNIKESMAVFQKSVMDIPGMKENPQIKQMINNITKIIPGG